MLRNRYNQSNALAWAGHRRLGMNKPRNRKQAELLGFNTYFTGKACKRGGIADRRLNGDCLCDACLNFSKLLKSDWSKVNKEKNKAWRESNPEKMKAYKDAWTARNKQKAADNIKKWKAANKDKLLADFHRRRAAKINATPSWYGEFDAFVMHEASRLARLRESITGVKWHIDHMIPLQATLASGFHCADNIQVIPETLNVTKAHRMMYTERHEWLQHL
jgi:uncharacterized Zn finger protein (UPF0148 family)